MRHTLGFNPYTPFIWAGIRMLPPMSVPQPTTVPWRDRSAPSPPVEPPGVNLGFFGCTVSPQRGFSVSHHWERQNLKLHPVPRTSMGIRDVP